MEQYVKRLVDGYKTGYSLEQSFYTGTEIFNAERGVIWNQHWLYAGAEARMPYPGDYFTYKVLQNEVIIIRGNNGAIHAHYNTCTHRGSAICLKEEGNAAKLICPYHQWVFDKDGTLLKARMMGDDFCKEGMGLRPVAVQAVEGLIFISFAQIPPDFSSVRNSLAPYLKPYKLATAKMAAIKTHRLRANWKLVAENFRECYHCGGAHPEYCNAVAGASLKEDTSDLTLVKQKDWTDAGLAVNLVEVTEGTTTYAIRYPLKPGVESYSLDGKKVAPPMGEHSGYDAGVVGLVNYPNFWLDAVSDYLWTMRITPVSPGYTDIEFCWLVDEKAVEGADYNINNLTAFWDITGGQDGQLCENNFRGIETDGYRPGPYAPVEDQVVNFVDWCITQLKKLKAEK